MPGLNLRAVADEKSGDEVGKGTKVVARVYHIHPSAGVAVVATAAPVRRASKPILFVWQSFNENRLLVVVDIGRCFALRGQRSGPKQSCLVRPRDEVHAIFLYQSSRLSSTTTPTDMILSFVEVGMIVRHDSSPQFNADYYAAALVPRRWRWLT